VSGAIWSTLWDMLAAMLACLGSPASSFQNRQPTLGEQRKPTALQNRGCGSLALL
jgi:hypothetical protein